MLTALLWRINQFSSVMAEVHAETGEDEPQSVSVTFEFAPALGRTVIAHFDGALNDRRISDESEVHEFEATKGAQSNTVSENAEQRFAKHGFFLSEDVRGSTEADELANTFADLIKSMQEGEPDKG